MHLQRVYLQEHLKGIQFNKRKTMARIITTVSREVRKYTPKDWLLPSGEPEEKALVIHFQPLSKRQLAQFADNSTRLSIQSNTILIGNAENAINVFKTALVGWDNFLADGKPLEFKKDNSTGLLDEDIVEIIPLDIIEEVANHIVKTSRFPEEELKK